MSRGGPNCVPRVQQSKLGFCESPVEGHKVPGRDNLSPASHVSAKQVHAHTIVLSSHDYSPW